MFFRNSRESESQRFCDEAKMGRGKRKFSEALELWFAKIQFSVEIKA